MFYRISCVVFVLFLFFYLATPSEATLFTDSTEFPPPEGMYVGDEPVFYGGGEFGLLDLTMQNPSNHMPLLPETSFHIDSFFDIYAQSYFDGYGTFPIEATPNVSINVNYTGQTGTFQTEILSMDIFGNTPMGQIIIRESPYVHSYGQTIIQDLGGGGGGGGGYQIDSFFDIYTELSVDGGYSWLPCDMPMHLDLEPVPEPSTIVLLGLAALALIGWQKFRK
jgi:hypothetical protein